MIEPKGSPPTAFCLYCGMAADCPLDDRVCQECWEELCDETRWEQVHSTDDWEERDAP